MATSTQNDAGSQTTNIYKFDDMTVELVRPEEARCVCHYAEEASTGPGHRSPHPYLRRKTRFGRHHARRSTSSWLICSISYERGRDLLVLCVWLLSALRAPLAMSAPMGSLDSRFNTTPKWINPCGKETMEFYSPEMESRPSDEENGKLFDKVLLQAKIAHSYAEDFKEKYVQQTFNVGFTQWHDTWKGKHYDWLPSYEEIPKSLGEPAPLEHLEKLDKEQALKDIYQYLQKYAVGLEQITWDQEDYNGDFQKSFKNAEHSVKMTLCEMKMLMLERKVEQHTNVDRDLMDSRFRQVNSTSHRNLRDWVIYRDYMNGLEYAIQVFEYFKGK